MTLEFHPLANLFPLIEGDDFKALVADVKAHGVREPITLYAGQILDGRNRYRAALAAKLIAKDFDPWATRPKGSIKGPFVEYFAKGAGDPLAFVLSKNLARRHLDESQRAAVADRLAQLKHGGDRKTKKDTGVPGQAAAAAAMGVSERLVQHARVVREKGTAELARAVDRGQIAVSLAAQATKLAPEQQKKVVAEAAAGRANAVRTVVKTAARAAKEKDLGAKQKALPDKTYGVILADPEWRFEPYSRETGMDRAPENHYPTSPTETIAARPVAKIAAKDCALFLWATAPMLPDAMAVMAAWGFTYRTHCIWRKGRAGKGRGPGYWFTGEHELLLLGTRGSVPAPAPGTQWPSVVDADAGKHSEKPEQFHRLIEKYFPSLPKIELNARRARKGWDSWGFEAPAEAAAEVEPPKPAGTLFVGNRRVASAPYAKPAAGFVEKPRELEQGEP